MTATPPSPLVAGFYEKRSGSIQYVVTDPGSGHCAIIDPVLDFDPCSGATASRSADAILAYIRDQGLTVDWILDTHPHADHFSAAAYLKAATGAPTAIGARITDVQRLWQRLYNFPESFRTDGSQWDQLFTDGECFRVGGMEVAVLFSPGHTMASITYVAGDAAFIHDTLFMPDSGTARTDFPGGDARQLWHSIQRIMALPDHTRLFTGHDYESGGRAPAWESSLRQQREGNAFLVEQTADSFVARRVARDRTLPIPKLMLAALQVNIAGGRLPEPEGNGCRYLKIPLNALGDTAPWG